MSKSLKAINKVPFAPVVAIAFGLVTAALTFAIPAWRFAQLIIATGLPNILSAARPPLGDTARALFAIGVGLSVCAMLWIGLSLLRTLFKRAKPSRTKAKGSRIDPVVVSASNIGLNAAGQRSPIFAERDLGAPFMSDEVLSTQGFEADVPEAEELTLETSWADAAPPAFEVTSEPTKPDIAPETPRAHEAVELPPVANQRLSDLIVRLDTAVEARNNREVIRPSGDILSLRRALSDLFESRVSVARD